MRRDRLEGFVMERRMPGGRTRVSEAVLDTIIMTSAREVQGVVDITGLATSALVGGVVGGALGFAGGGGGGAALGASVGSAAGAAAAHWSQRAATAYHEINEEPDVVVRLSACYGASLLDVAEAVRTRVRVQVRRMAGLELGEVRVLFTHVEPPPPGAAPGSRSRFDEDDTPSKGYL